jgi:DNA-directed RNA polymerase specialized sigma24 family protein
MPFDRRRLLRAPGGEPTLYASIRRLLERRGVASADLDDRCQHVLLQAHAADDAPRGEPERTRYVHGIARNVARQYWADRRAAPEILPLDEDAEGRASSSPPYEAVDFARKVLGAALADDPQGSDWVVRAKVHGETDQAIAEADGVPKARVRKRVSRVLAKMREHAVGLTALAVTVLLVVAAAIDRWRVPGRGEPGEGTPPPPSEIAPRSRALAAELRQRGLADCQRARWDVCERELDEARGIDPGGEADEAVKRARGAIAAAKVSP